MFIPWGTVWYGLAGKSVLLLCAPVGLYVSGFFERGEIERFGALLGEVRRRAGGFLSPSTLPEKKG
jgi:hypothetical protein